MKKLLFVFLTPLLLSATSLAGQTLTLTLVNANTNADIRQLNDGDTLNLSTLPTQDLNVRAGVNASIGSVKFGLDGNSNYRIESVAPYALVGDQGGDYYSWTPSVGRHTLTATAYSGGGASGSTVAATTVSFTVINNQNADCNGDVGGSAFRDDCGICAGGNTGKTPNADKDDCGICNGNNASKDCNGVCSGAAFVDDCGVCAGGTTGKQPNADKDNCGVCNGDGSSCSGNCQALEIVSLTLVKTDGSDIAVLTNGYVINKSAIGAFSVRADPCSGSVGSVIFKLDGNQIQNENQAPYSINGDNSSGYTAWNIAPGSYTLTATPYSNGNGNGTQGIAETVNITVTDGSNTDCNGDVGGSAFIDNCNVCAGGNTGKVPNADADDCGVCNGNNANKDCNGDCFGTAAIDDCGVCSGGNTNKIPNASKDDCGVCGGDNSTCNTACNPLEVTSFTLVQAGNGGTDIGQLKDGDVIDVATTGNFSIRANVCDDPVGSVEFLLNGNSIQVENVMPYSIAGDGAGGYNSWNPGVGTYTLIGVPYSGSNTNGTQGKADTVNFSIVDNGGNNVDCNGDANGSASIDDCGVCAGGNTGKTPNADQDDCGVCNGNNQNKDCNGDCFGTADFDDCNICSGGNTGVNPNSEKDSCGVCFGDNSTCNTACVQNEVVSFTLVFSGNGGDIRELINGDIIDRNATPSFSVRADVCDDPVGSVIFKLNGTVVQTENSDPYSINGDGANGYNAWNIPAGNYTLMATPYSNGNGNGTAGVSHTVSFSVVDPNPSNDCNGVPGGSAFIDDCGVCAGGNTGKTPNADKDNCGVCNGDGSSCNGNAGCGEFIEANGLVVVELESVPPSNNTWYVGSGPVNGLNVPPSSGQYYMWNAFCGSPPSYSGCTGADSPTNSKAMDYEIKINTPGRYRFQMRSWQPGIKYGSHGAGTENNDFWLQLPDGGGKKIKGGTVINIGTNEWVKVYQNTTNQYVWRTTTVDHNPHDIYVDFPSAGTYTVKIGARSKLMALDRFVLYRSGNTSNNVSETSATTDLPAESNRGACASVANSGNGGVNSVNAGRQSTGDVGTSQNTTSGTGSDARSGGMSEEGLANILSVYPNPTTGKFTLGFSVPIDGPVEVVVYNQIGQVVFHQEGDSDKLNNHSLQVENLASGIYLVKVKTGNQSFEEKVVVQ